MFVLVTAAGKGTCVQLAYNLKAGEHLTYRFTQSGTTTLLVTGAEREIVRSEAHITNVQEVISAGVSGEAVVLMRFRDGVLKVTSPEKTIEMPLEIPNLKMTVSRDGRVMSAVCDGAERGESAATLWLSSGLSMETHLAQVFRQMSVLRFPARDLKIGDTWSETTQPTDGVGVTAHSRLMRLLEMRGHVCAQTETTATFPVKTQVAVMNGTASVESVYQVRTRACFAMHAGRLIDLKGKADVDQKIQLQTTEDDTQKKPATQVVAQSSFEFSMTLE